MKYLLAIDQGTTSSRAIIFNQAGEFISQHQIDLTQYYPHEGWVEQDPEEMWLNTLECCRLAIHKSNLSTKSIAAIGITNQRETTIIWDKNTGKPIHRAIVWQDRRTSDFCKKLSDKNLEKIIQTKTGLLIDPYFSATKIYWLLENIPHAREKAQHGELLFGTVDTFLLWRLTKGKTHATDATNASRTLLFNLRDQQWDPELLDIFSIPMAILPNVYDTGADFGYTDKEWFGVSIPITSLIGDQQAATVGQACFEPGKVKSTYGTGCFMLLNTGEKFTQSSHKLLTTVAYRLNKKVTYGLEGSIFCAGATVKWLRDKLKMIKNAAETEELANSVSDTEGVYLIPAFTGLGAPYWQPEAKAALIGLTRNSGIEHIVRAGLEAVAYQTLDLLNVMQKESQIVFKELRVDGGMMKNNWLVQFLADMLQVNICLPKYIETTALGAALIAGLQAGLYSSMDEIANVIKLQKTFHPTMTLEKRNKLYQGWQKALRQFYSINE